MLRDLLYSTTWYNPLFEHINSTSFNALEAFVDNEYSTYKAINPDYNDIFKAYNITHFDDVKVIIIGQDPYHTPHKATGIAFQMPINTAIYAYRYKHCIDASKHLILHTTHPSPLSYTRGFKGCKHFSMCNTYLIKHDKKPILWG